MPKPTFKDVLRQLGWAEGFNLPVANDENRHLEKEIENLLKRKAEAIVSFESSKDRTNALKRHSDKLTDEKSTNQNLMVSLRKALDSEIIALRDCESELSNKKSDMKEMDNETARITERTDKIKNEINKYNVELERLKKTLEWEEEALFSWEEQMAKGEHHTSILRHLQLQDEDKFNELEVKRKMLQNDLIYRQEVEQKETDLMLRAEKLFFVHSKIIKELTNERQKLINRYYDATKLMKHRENQIMAIFEEIDNIHLKARDNFFQLEEKRKMYENLSDENSRLKFGITDLKVQGARAKELSESYENEIKALKQQVASNGKISYDLSTKLEVQRASNKEIIEEIKAQTMKASNLNHVAIKLRTKIDAVNVKMMTVEQKYKNAEDVYEIGQKVSREEEKELERLQGITFSLASQLVSLKNDMKIKVNEYEVCEKSVRQLEKDIADQAKDVEDLQTILEQKELALELLNQQQAKMIEDEMCLDLENRIKEQGAEIDKQIENNKTEQALLRVQIKLLKKELSELNSLLTRGQQELNHLNSKSVELKLQMNSSKKRLEGTQEEYTQRLLDLNLIRMQASLAKDTADKEKDGLCCLERKKILIDTAMQERNLEIKARKEVLISKKRVLEEEKSALKKNVEHFHQRLKQLDTRYEIELDKLGKDEEGEKVSVAYFKIKMAQQKHELIELGNELEAKINKTEKEIQAMENTLRLVSSANDNYKINVEAIDTNGPEMQELENLEIEFHDLHEKYMESYKALQEIDKETAQTKKKIEKLQQAGKEIELQWKTKEKEIVALSKVLLNKQIKLARTTKLLRKIIRELKNTKGMTSNYKHALRDIQVRIQSEQNKTGIHQLHEFTAFYPEVRPVVNRLLLENNLAEVADSFKKEPMTPSPSRNTLSRLSITSEGTDEKLRGSSPGSGLGSVSPSVVLLDPTLLISNEDKRHFKNYNQRK